ncbi:hypothetical protein M405DRAFT_808527 [Rhizopogon salebrosus TDB-379]|nr:hypothetical protein M405DRAFT_808527 [Rhizopogon salebrosus TDB-379]
MRHHETPPLQTSRPLFQHDRCIITVTQGGPEAFDRRRQTYIVASDLSEESRYAVEWGIGTVIRDGDHLIVPPDFVLNRNIMSLAYILVRQVISSCQASDYNEPTTLIMGSRGLGQIKG